MKNQNWQPKYKAFKMSMGQDEQSRVTSAELDKLSLSELGKVSAGEDDLQPRPEDN